MPPRMPPQPIMIRQPGMPMAAEKVEDVGVTVIGQSVLGVRYSVREEWIEPTLVPRGLAVRPASPLARRREERPPPFRIATRRSAAVIGGIVGGVIGAVALGPIGLVVGAGVGAVVNALRKFGLPIAWRE